jgi:hypothetical protein
MALPRFPGGVGTPDRDTEKSETKKASRTDTLPRRNAILSLPSGTLAERWWRRCFCWETGITHFNTNLPSSFYANTEAHTRAKLLIYLLENKLATLQVEQSFPVKNFLHFAVMSVL